MKYHFIASDIHSFKKEYDQALEEAGFDKTNPDHIIDIAGDAFDRGEQSKELLQFLLEMDSLGRLNYVRGNHEDLLFDCLSEIWSGRGVSSHHIRNGTLGTISQITGISEFDLRLGVFESNKLDGALLPLVNLISRSRNFIEIGNYIIVHGWIPVLSESILPPNFAKDYEYMENWRDADKFSWSNARWLCGMQMFEKEIVEPGKTIICGHWHVGYGHKNIHKTSETEFDDFSPFIDEGIIAIDACTARSRKVNVIVIKEE